MRPAGPHPLQSRLGDPRVAEAVCGPLDPGCVRMGTVRQPRHLTARRGECPRSAEVPGETTRQITAHRTQGGRPRAGARQGRGGARRTVVWHPGVASSWAQVRAAHRPAEAVVLGSARRRQGPPEPAAAVGMRLAHCGVLLRSGVRGPRVFRTHPCAGLDSPGRVRARPAGDYQEPLRHGRHRLGPVPSEPAGGRGLRLDAAAGAGRWQYLRCEPPLRRTGDARLPLARRRDPLSPARPEHLVGGPCHRGGQPRATAPATAASSASGPRP